MHAHLLVHIRRSSWYLSMDILFVSGGQVPLKLKNAPYVEDLSGEVEDYLNAQTFRDTHIPYS